MRQTKLILLEGLSGLGKSTLAQSIAHRMDRQGIVYRWCYEEEKEHPLFIFYDALSLEQTREALSEK